MLVPLMGENPRSWVGKQAVAPPVSVYRPAGQLEHGEDLPVVATKVLMAHDSQEDLPPFRLNFPASHGVQAVAPGALV